MPTAHSFEKGRPTAARARLRKSQIMGASTKSLWLGVVTAFFYVRKARQTTLVDDNNDIYAFNGTGAVGRYCTL
jgi:hypothetical protein